MTKGTRTPEIVLKGHLVLPGATLTAVHGRRTVVEVGPDVAVEVDQGAFARYRGVRASPDSFGYLS